MAVTYMAAFDRMYQAVLDTIIARVGVGRYRRIQALYRRLDDESDRDYRSAIAAAWHEQNLMGDT